MKYQFTLAAMLFINTITMSKEIKTQILINASPEKVWAILTNFEKYSEWNPFIQSISGNPVVGLKIKAKLQPPGASGMTFTPTVLAFETNKEFKWIGHLLFNGLFDGEHKFELIDNHDGTTTFIQSEKFKGILVPIFKKMLEVNTLNGFQQMNEKLKARVEK